MTIAVKKLDIDNISSEAQPDWYSDVPSLAGAVAHGAIIGVREEVRAIRDGVVQGIDDFRAIDQLTASYEHTESPRKESIRRRIGIVALKAWYLGPLPLYQLGDDFATYPLYLSLKDKHGAGSAALTTMAVTVGGASALAFGQRKVEAKKAQLRGLETETYEGSLLHDAIDASVNSAPWITTRHANEPRAEGAPVPIVSKKRVAAAALSYAVVNTALYAGADSLPYVNSWTGFGMMLAANASFRGALRAVSDRKRKLQHVSVVGETGGVSDD